MSSPLQVEYPGTWYHIMNRGRRGEQFLSVSKDYADFVELMKEAVELWDVRISGFDCPKTSGFKSEKKKLNRG